MEEIDLLKLWEDIEDIPVQYRAVYDPETLRVVKVGPNITSENDDIVDIEEDIAVRILEGEVRINNCFLDIDSGKLEIAENHSLNKIDDVLHRIPETFWSDYENADVYATINIEKGSVEVMLGHQWGGNYVDEKATSIAKPRKIFWQGETEMEFLVTELNDPNIIYDKFSFSVKELSEGNIKQKINVPHKDISLYTRRLFKKYVMDIL